MTLLFLFLFYCLFIYFLQFQWGYLNCTVLSDPKKIKVQYIHVFLYVNNCLLTVMSVTTTVYMYSKFGYPFFDLYFRIVCGRHFGLTCVDQQLDYTK